MLPVSHYGIRHQPRPRQARDAPPFDAGARWPEGWAQRRRLSPSRAARSPPSRPAARHAPATSATACCHARRCRTCTATPSSAAWPASPSGAGRPSDSFWTWREVMYRFLARMTPDDIEAVAAQLPMSRCWRPASPASASSTTCTTTPDGTPYADPAETARAHRRRGRADGHRPHPAAVLLCPRRLRRTAAHARARRASCPISTALPGCWRRAGATSSAGSRARRSAIAPHSPARGRCGGARGRVRALPERPDPHPRSPSR